MSELKSNLSNIANNISKLEVKINIAKQKKDMKEVERLNKILFDQQRVEWMIKHGKQTTLEKYGLKL